MHRALLLLAVASLLTVPAASAEDHFPGPVTSCDDPVDHLCRYCAAPDGSTADPSACRGNEPGYFWNTCFVWAVDACQVYVTA